MKRLSAVLFVATFLAFGCSGSGGSSGGGAGGSGGSAGGGAGGGSGGGVAGNSWSLDGVTTTGSVQCTTDLIAGSASNRTAFQFVFKGAPGAGTYTVEPATSRAARPMADGGVVVSYGSDPAGGTKVEQVGQSGTITVDLVGGKLHAKAVAIPAKDLATQTAGTIAGDLTCP